MTQETSERRGRKSAACAYAVIAAFVVALLWRLVCGRALYWGDIGVYFAPMGNFLQRSLQTGRIPLWNPYVLGGQPFVGNPQMAVFYPNTLLLYLMPAWAALSLLLGIHLFLCAAFLFAYLRRWTESDVSALAGGLIYAGSACLVARMQFPPMVYSAAYLPLLLLLIDRQIERPGLQTALLLGVALGLLILAGHTQMAYFETALAVLYLGTRLFLRYRREKLAGEFPNGAARRRWVVRNLAPFFMSGLLGVCLSAAQIVPAAQLVAESPRERLTVAQANRFFLEARQLLTLVFPRFTGHPANGDYHAAGNAWEPALFMGWIPLLLIAMALRNGRLRRVRYSAYLASFGLWLAFGAKGGLYTVAFYLIPGLSKFHDPARFLYFTTFGLAVLSAFGLDRIRGSGVGVRVSKMRVSGFGCRVSDGLLLAGIALPLIVYGWDWNPTTEPRNLLTAEFSRYPTPDTRTPIPASSTPCISGRVYLPEYGPLWSRYISYYDFGRNDARTVTAFRKTLTPNIGMDFGVESLAGYEPVPLSAPFALEGLTGMLLLRGEPNATRLIALLNANTVITPTAWEIPDTRLIPLDGGRSAAGMKWYANRDALLRFWLVRRTRRVEGRTRILAALSDPGFDPAAEAVVSCGLNDALAEQTGGTNWNFGTEAPFVSPMNSAEAPRGRGVHGGAAGVDRGGNGAGGPRIRAVNDPSGEPAAERSATGARESDTAWTVQADAGKRPAYLVASLMAYPGWQAVVDGRTEIPLRTDGAIMGIPLAAGRHRVTFRYEPAAYRVGLYLSLLSCAVVSLGAGYLLAARSRGIRP